MFKYLNRPMFLNRRYIILCIYEGRFRKASFTKTICGIETQLDFNTIKTL